MSLFSNVVKIVSSEFSSSRAVQSFFSKYGQICACYSYVPPGASHLHAFIEFAMTEGARKARSRSDPNIRVLPLEENFSLTEEYCTLRDTSSTHGQRIERQAGPLARSTSGESARNLVAERRKSCQGDNNLHSLADAHDMDRQHSPPGSHLQDSRGLSFGAKVKGDTDRSENTSLLPSPPTPSDSNHPAITVLTPTSLISDSPLCFSSPLPRSVPTVSFSLGSCVSINFCGENIVYDLDALDSDPKLIIELLKWTATERADWMVIAAHYRRKGNPRAAIDVVLSMIETLSQHGVSDDNLKPAFLMLSGCETDLAKAARLDGATPALVSQHYDKSKAWLQKVYGTEATLQTFSAGIGLRLNMGTDGSPPSPTSVNLPNMPLSVVVSATKAQTFSASSTSCVCGSSDHSSMQRELQSLRRQQASQASCLADVRAAKRKLEEDHAFERSLRRKLEKRIEVLQHERNAAKRMERQALDRMKLAERARAKAEREAEEERLKSRESERRAVKPLFENLATMFQKAAQGQVLNFRDGGKDNLRAELQ